MSDAVLSQAELDALLAAQSANGSTVETPSASTGEESLILDDQMRDAVGEIGNITLGAAATALSTLVGRPVSITTPQVRLARTTDVDVIQPTDQVMVSVDYDEGLHGNSIFLLRQTDAATIGDLMMGGDGRTPAALDEVRLSAVAEAMNQMMGAAATGLAGVLRERVGITPPKTQLVDLTQAEDRELVSASGAEHMVETSFHLDIDDLVHSEFIQLLPFRFTRELVDAFYAGTVHVEEAATTVEAPPRPAARPPLPSTSGWASEPSTPVPVGGGGRVAMANEFGARPGGVTVQSAQFAPLSSQPVAHSNPNLHLLMDVQLQVTVELGRTKMLIKDILELGKGSLLELEKFAGEPVDVLVNGKLIAKGEVVVIDENFGVKIVDIVTPVERVQNLQ